MKAADRLLSDVSLCANAYDVALDSDALILLTDWPEFRDLDLYRLRSLVAQPYFVDGRNIFNPSDMEAAGFVYTGVGRGYGSRLDSGSRAQPMGVHLANTVSSD